MPPPQTAARRLLYSSLTIADASFRRSTELERFNQLLSTLLSPSFAPFATVTAMTAPAADGPSPHSPFPVRAVNLARNADASRAFLAQAASEAFPSAVVIQNLVWLSTSPPLNLLPARTPPRRPRPAHLLLTLAPPRTAGAGPAHPVPAPLSTAFDLSSLRALAVHGSAVEWAAYETFVLSAVADDAARPPPPPPTTTTGVALENLVDARAVSQLEHLTLTAFDVYLPASAPAALAPPLGRLLLALRAHAPRLAVVDLGPVRLGEEGGLALVRDVRGFLAGEGAREGVGLDVRWRSAFGASGGSGWVAVRARG